MFIDIFDQSNENVIKSSSIDKISNMKEFLCVMNNFLNNINSKISLQYCDIDSIKLNIQVTKKNNNSNICRAIVQDNITGHCRQCTRKKKFGDVCGLHNKRKNSFKMVPTCCESETSKLFIDLYSLISKKKITKNTDSLRKII